MANEKKPWEEEWTQSDDRWVESPCPLDGKPVTVGRFDGRERTKLASAAPDMARALRSLVDAFPPAASEEEDEALEFARKALRKAGVLP